MADKLALPNPERRLDETATPELTDDEIVQVLEGYRMEAEDARKTGLNPRDEQWAKNLDLYWNRFDFSQKAKWQAKEVLPEVPTFVDRFAAALKEALTSDPKGFYTVTDESDREGDLAQAIKRMTDVWLARSGRNQMGHVMDFSGVFEEQMKLGALMACSAVVTWKEDLGNGRVAIDPVDPRSVWLDHTTRGLYRVRRIEIDKHELVQLAGMKDREGKSLFNVQRIKDLVDSVVQEAMQEREAMTGTGQEIISNRKPIELHEYLATILAPDGRVVGERALCVVANKKFLIRGPEKNPFWHGRDWMVFSPLITSPLSVYGRSYMEDFGSVAKTFNELTNMILDAVFTSSLKAFAMVPGLLINPGQVSEGISPNKIFLLEDGVRPQDFFKEMEMGNLPAESIQVWQALKNELREAAGQSEIAVGQFAPKGRTSATEILETQQGTSALIRSVASTIESRWLNPVLDLVWRTGLQHVKADDPLMQRAVGKDMFRALISRRKELASRPTVFSAKGISMLLHKAKKLRAILSALQIMGSNELLLREFMRVVSVERLVEMLLTLFDIDVSALKATGRENMIRETVQGLEQRQGQVEEANKGRSAAPGTMEEAQEISKLLGSLAGGGGAGG